MFCSSGHRDYSTFEAVATVAVTQSKQHRGHFLTNVSLIQLYLDVVFNTVVLVAFTDARHGSLFRATTIA